MQSLAGIPKLKPPGEIRIGNKYRVGRKIGGGSFGDIYLGRSLLLLLRGGGAGPGKGWLEALVLGPGWSAGRAGPPRRARVHVGRRLPAGGRVVASLSPSSRRP